MILQSRIGDACNDSLKVEITLVCDHRWRGIRQDCVLMTSFLANPIIVPIISFVCLNIWSFKSLIVSQCCYYNSAGTDFMTITSHLGEIIKSKKYYLDN